MMKQFKSIAAALVAAATIVPCFGAIRVNAASGIPIDSAHFPDANFRAIIESSVYDKDGNGYLSDSEISETGNIYCENSNIYSVKGIEYFTEIEGLWCLNNNISSWDLSKNTHLKGIWCSHNDFTKLDFTANKELEWVYCYNCQLTELDVSNCPELGYIECNSNPNLKTLNVKGCPKLENLYCSSCGLTSLDLSANPLLCELDCYKNNLTSLNFSNNLKLKRLDIWDNWGLGDVDISMLKGLQFYNCAKTNATKLDMSNNPELTMLIASYNENLKSVNLTKNPKLAYLNLECDWRLPSLDISQNPKIYHFYAWGLRGLSTLKIGNNPRLVKTYKEGVYKKETQLGSRVVSYTINYGGSGDYFDDLVYVFGFDNDVKVDTTYNSKGASDSPDTWVDTNDGHSNSESFATRGEAIALLYEMAGSPGVSGTSRFTDISNSPYKNAILWGEQNNICFGAPNICSNTFKPDDLISREDFALMAHRMAAYMKFGTAFDYGRTDWYTDFYSIEYYAWGPFTWAMQWKVLEPNGNMCYPHGRLTKDELKKGANQIFNLDGHASYSAIVNGNGGTGSAVYNHSAAGGTGYNGGAYGGDPTKPSVQINFTPTTGGGGFEDFVERLYVVALGRASEPEGKEFWCTHVGNGDLTGAECANEFLLSKEFNERYLDDENFLKVLYGTFFNRKAEEDKEGFNFWMNSLKTDGRATVVDCFINSQEWCNVCASYGVKSGATRAKATIASKNAKDFATRLYTECLGRDPETDGLNFWSLGLTNLELTGSQAAHEFFFSKEFNDHNYGNEELLTRMYKTFMGRDPDTDGMNYWLGEMNNGMTKQQVFDSFVQSKEFTQICKDYAIDRG